MVLLLYLQSSMLDTESVLLRQRSRIIARFPITGQPHIDQKAVWDYEGLVQGVSIMPHCVSGSLVIILITSALENRLRRDVIRNTWCTRSQMEFQDYQHIPLPFHLRDITWRCVFLMGSSRDHSMNREIQQEVLLNQDVLLGNYMDSYRNLSLKVLTGFHWTSTTCSPSYILKTDDDCFVNIHLLLPFLALQPPDMKTRIYSGKMFNSYEGKTEVIRNPNNKWHITQEEYAPDFYPTYASGTGYILSGDVVKAVLQASRLFKPFPNEDAYIGVLVDLAKVTPLDSFRFSFFNEKWSLCNYMYFLVLHQVLPEQQGWLMDRASKGIQECKEEIRTQWD